MEELPDVQRWLRKQILGSIAIFIVNVYILNLTENNVVIHYIPMFTKFNNSNVNKTSTLIKTHPNLKRHMKLALTYFGLFIPT